MGTGQHPGTSIGPRICGQTMWGEAPAAAAGAAPAKTQIEAIRKTSDDGGIKRRIAGTRGSLTRIL
jgi:hypothetical protein